MNPPNRLAHLFICRGGNRAGVQHNQAGIVKIGDGAKSARGEPGFERRAVGLGGTAAEILDPKPTQSTILACLSSPFTD